MALNLKVIEKGFEVIGKLFNYFSSKERVARRKISTDDKLKKAIGLEEEHYQILDDFIDFVTPRIALDGKHDKKEYARYCRQFDKDKSTFFKWT